MEVDHSAAEVPASTAAFFQWGISSAPDKSSSGYGSSNYSGASYLSNDSGCSASGAAGFRKLGVKDLEDIARRLISDGNMEDMVQEFESADPELALDRWFKVLDVAWVLQIRGHDGLLELPGDKSLQELVESWNRALSIIVFSVTELRVTKPMLAMQKFATASIGKMELFIAAIVSKGLPPAEKLQAMLNIYICVTSVPYFLTGTYAEDQISLLLDLSLSRAERVLSERIRSMVKEIRTLMEEDSWTIDIHLGGSEVHRNTQFMLDCIARLRNAKLEVQTQGNLVFQVGSFGSLNFADQIDRTINCLKNLLENKSELCSDPSLKYLFLLNNFYFVAQNLEPKELTLESWWIIALWRLPAECERYMDSYFDASWAPVLSCLSNPGPSYGWNKASSLAKFESAFHTTYQAQKFWKIPDPKVRDKVRRTIANRVISGYRKYLEEHPELEKRLSHGSSTPDALEEMLGELFEGQKVKSI